MLESRNPMSRPEARSAAIVGFTPLERAGLVLLLQEHAIDVTEMVDELALLDPCFERRIVLIDLAAAALNLTRLDAIRMHLGILRNATVQLNVIGICRDISGGVPSTLASLDFDVLVDAASRPENLLAVILGLHQGRRLWSKPTISAVPLSTREQQILSLIAGGCTSKGIATSLGISGSSQSRV
jgi:DNA-binding NarL/FixJ family response regulator